MLYKVGSCELREEETGMDGGIEKEKDTDRVRGEDTDTDGGIEKETGMDGGIEKETGMDEVREEEVQCGDGVTEEGQVEDATDVGEDDIEKLVRVAESMMESSESEGEYVSQLLIQQEPHLSASVS